MRGVVVALALLWPGTAGALCISSDDIECLIDEAVAERVAPLERRIDGLERLVDILERHIDALERSVDALDPLARPARGKLPG